MANIHIVSTPIGNLGDITFRAVEILKNSDLIICEDTRVSKKLLDNYNIKARVTSLNEFNEEQKIYELLAQIENMENVSIISDAGTPLLSDPGYKFIRAASRKGYRITPIPGASAILASLVASSMPTNSFTFLGFLPKSVIKQKKIFEKYRDINMTIVFFESPYRIIKTLQTLKDVFGDINLSVSRELTKKFEEINNLPISQHQKTYENKKPKGEFTLCFNSTVKGN